MSYLQCPKVSQRPHMCPKVSQQPYMSPEVSQRPYMCPEVSLRAHMCPEVSHVHDARFKIKLSINSAIFLTAKEISIISTESTP